MQKSSLTLNELRPMELFTTNNSVTNIVEMNEFMFTRISTKTQTSISIVL